MFQFTNRKPKALVFTRFKRAGYSVFASLHREVRIGVLSVGMLASVNIPKVQAIQVSTTPEAEEEADETELAEVSVAGTMAPLTALQSARLVSVITRQQIESAAVQSVNDLLKLATGVDVRQRGGFGIQTDISIDGGTFDQITLLLNGINISSPHTGHLAADFPVNLSDIERIEVLEGAASRVYGASAFGGAINIVTRKGGRSVSDAPLTWEAGVQGGSYGTVGGDARLAWSNSTAPSNRFLSLSGQYHRTDGATVNSDFGQGKSYLRGALETDDYIIDVQAGFSRKSYGANTFYSAAYPNQYERNTRFLVSIGAESKGRVRVRPEIYWSRLYDNFELTKGKTAGENFHRSDVHGARVTADVRWAVGRTAVGAELREEGILSTTLGRPITGKLFHRIPGEDNYYSRQDDRTNMSVNIEHNILLEHWTMSVGLLGNYNTRFDHRIHFYPGIDLAYSPTPHWRIYASYNKGFRLPTFTDLYYKSPTHQGNQGMRAEESHSFQLGVSTSQHLGAFYAQLSAKGFYHRGTNLIDWVMYSPTDVFHSANFDLDNTGLQVQGSLRAAESNSLLQDLTVGYTFIHQHRRDNQEIYKSNYAMEYLRHKLVATLTHRIVGRLSASWSVRCQDRMGSYLRYENNKSTGQLVNYHPYTTLDVKLRWNAPHYELWAEATNLTDHTYYDLGNIPQPGLVVQAGARIRF